MEMIRCTICWRCESCNMSPARLFSCPTHPSKSDCHSGWSMLLLGFISIICRLIHCIQEWTHPSSSAPVIGVLLAGTRSAPSSRRPIPYHQKTIQTASPPASSSSFYDYFTVYEASDTASSAVTVIVSFRIFFMAALQVMQWPGRE